MAKFIVDTVLLAAQLKKVPDQERGDYLRQSFRLMHSGTFSKDTMPIWAKPLDRETDDAKDLDSPYTDVFLQFWDLYPSHKRKTGKGAAFRRWQAIKGNKQTLLNKCAAALEWQVKEWAKEDNEYVPMPETYLNKRRFDDDPPEHSEDSRNGMVMNAFGVWVHE